MGSSLPSLAAALKTEADRLGFDLIGITTPDPPPHFDVYRQWLDAGHHGEMHYLASSRAVGRRADPLTIFPDCRSIVVLGIRYPTPSTTDAGSGRVAAYALGDDYHDFLPPRLEALATFLEAQVGTTIPHRAYTDTGPLLERDLAQRAGLGWIGKNTCLIHPAIGSYLLLAELLLDLDLPPDPPFQADRCGTCTRCIEACPTHCILPDRTLDASRCISYCTIELKGSIPLQLRPAQGTWLFGCDACQEVCPWNRRAEDGHTVPAFTPRRALNPPDIAAILQMDASAFRQTLRGSPLRRAGRRGLLRNAAVAAGNAGAPELTPALARLLEHEPEAIVRALAAWALGQIGGQDAVRALEHAAAGEVDESVRAEVQLALRVASGPASP